jgi:hypothetical protein
VPNEFRIFPEKTRKQTETRTNAVEFVMKSVKITGNVVEFSSNRVGFVLYLLQIPGNRLEVGGNLVEFVVYRL